MSKVIIYQYRLLHYRVKLFERLRSQCATKGIDLIIAHGNPSTREKKKRDVATLDWTEKVRNFFIPLSQVDLLFQCLSRSHFTASLVIVMQENRIISNYLIMLLSRLLGQKVAYWGHGYNFQSQSPKGLRERWKALLITKVDWWFAYTKSTVDYLLANGVSEHRITQLNNSIDTEGFMRDLKSVHPAHAAAFKRKYSVSENSSIAIYCGSLYRDKRLDFLFESADLIKKKVPNFHLFIIGDGPERPFVEENSKRREYIDYTGPLFGKDKATVFSISSIMLNPGLVGLHVVDCFCAGLVMVTTKGAKHSPEVDYLENGVNGIITGDSAEEYAGNVTRILRNKSELAKMIEASRQSAKIYSLDCMVNNFAAGIESCLKQRKST